MIIKKQTIVKPLPTDELILKKESMWEISLPENYKQFIKKFNGGEPIKSQFSCNNKKYQLSNFLSILEGDFYVNKSAKYDIDVIMTRLDEFIIYDEDLYRVQLLPIALLVGDEYLCFDYKYTTKNPSICLWSSLESSELNPVTYFVANDFDELLKLLY